VDVRRPLVRLLLLRAGLAQARTDHSPEERECLRRWATARRCLVELGVADGLGTSVLRSAMSPHGVIYAVDPYPKGRLGISAHAGIARLEAKRTPGPEPTWLRLGALEAAAVVAGRQDRPDFVFSDAAFRYEELDQVWRAWRPLIRAGGIWVQSTSRPEAGRTGPSHDTVRWTSDVLLRDPDFEEVDRAGTFTVLRRHDSST
jgi:predicted O-methyltransferase YrrM